MIGRSSFIKFHDRHSEDQPSFCLFFFHLQLRTLVTNERVEGLGYQEKSSSLCQDLLPTDTNAVRLLVYMLLGRNYFIGNLCRTKRSRKFGYLFFRPVIPLHGGVTTKWPPLPGYLEHNHHNLALSEIKEGPPNVQSSPCSVPDSNVDLIRRVDASMSDE
ncbi:hypothetical protein O6P43_002369 [Quillaja saponaria]|uniref:Uncharacterized protein n=1 Tax=Quillaja saponaria TaxID=32244 RepID=A0AAD7VKF0_QUISA|nr:hypothetical protein O6P43_002369 [Quillaja saponaria]